MPLTYFVHIDTSSFEVFISKAAWIDGVQTHHSLSGEAWAYHMGVF